MTKTIRIAYNPVVAKLMTDDYAVKIHISTLLSYMVDGAEHMPRFKEGKWDGRSTFFNYATATFPRGFLSVVDRELRKLGYDLAFIRRPDPEPLGPENPKVDSFPEDPRYDYQPETVRRLLKHGQMIARVATGGGKSRIAKLAIARIGRKTIFLTTRKLLMYQMKESLEKTGYEVGVLGDSEWSPARDVDVAMVQTLAMRLELPAENDHSPAANKQRGIRERTLKLLSSYEFVIGEEAHEVGGDSFFEILKHCINAYYRLALTATPFMRGDAEANMRLMGCFGPIGIEISEKMLIDSGILATPRFKYISTSRPLALRRTTAWPKCRELGIVENVDRNRYALAEAIRATRMGLTVMILVQQKKHGAKLETALRNAGIRVRYIFGETDNETRLEVLRQLREGELDCVIGSVILDVGVDVPAVGMIILLGGGKAEVALRQRVGRGLREKKHGPNVCYIVDFKDEFNMTLRNHALTRRYIIEQTPGFDENILADGADFPFAADGFAPLSLAV